MSEKPKKLRIQYRLVATTTEGEKRNSINRHQQVVHLINKFVVDLEKFSHSLGEQGRNREWYHKTVHFVYS